MLVSRSKHFLYKPCNLPSYSTVKYTQQGAIKVNARIHDEPHLWRPQESQFLIEVTISDTGCGIEGIRLESIFRELEQFEHSSSNSGSEHNATGLGLGLAVVARAINQIGGQLRVDSAPGQGSKFLCLIPFDVR